MSSSNNKRLLLIVTGGSRGFGRSVAKAFCKYPLPSASTSASRAGHEHFVPPEHVSVHLIARSADGMERTKQEILAHRTDSSAQHGGTEADGGRGDMGKDTVVQSHISVTTHVMDLSNLDTLDENLDRLFNPGNSTGASMRREITDSDCIILVNNAADLGTVGPCLDASLSLRGMRQTFDFNITSSLWTTVRFARAVNEVTAPAAVAEISTPPAACSTKAVVVVNVSSLVAIQAFPTMGMYSAGKAARDLFHSSLAKEIDGEEEEGEAQKGENDQSNPGERRVRMKVLNYAPGPLETEMVTEIRSSDRLHGTLKPFYQQKQLDPNDSAREMVNLILSDVASTMGQKGAAGSDEIKLPRGFKNGAHVDYYDLLSE